MTRPLQIKAATEGKAGNYLRNRIEERLLAEIEGAEKVEFQTRSIVVILHEGTNQQAAQQKLDRLLREHFSIVLPSPPPDDDLY
jgi:hypothetical protein